MSDPGRPRGDAVAHAPNWWQVLVADAGVGMAVVAAGVLVALWWTPAVGLPVLVAGAVYLGLVGRRAVRWARLRRTPPP